MMMLMTIGKTIMNNRESSIDNDDEDGLCKGKNIGNWS